MTITDPNPILPDLDGDERHLLSLPPRDLLPESVHAAYDDWQARIAAWAELDERRGSGLTRLAEADAKDRQTHVDAVRAGHDLNAIGTPHRDAALEDQRSLVHQEQAARIVAREARDRLYRALLAARDAELDHLAHDLDEAAATYTEAISAALQARRAYRWLRDRQHYWSTVALMGGPRWPAPISAGVEAHHHDLAESVLALRNAGMVDATGIED